MAIITFWTNEKKETGQTLSIAAIAAGTAIEHNYKILLISTQYNDDTLEFCFGHQDKNKNLVNKLVSNQGITIDTGIEGLSRMASSGRISPDVIPNYTHIVYNNRFEVLYGYRCKTGASNKEEYLKVKEIYKNIIQNANRYYDMVLIDLNKGLKDEMTKDILSMSDVIVYNITQKMSMIDNFAKLKNEIGLENKNNLILNIGKFDENSKYSIKNISRYLGIKKDIIAVPYNTLYFEASGEEVVADLFLKIRKVSGMDKNATFVKQVKESVERIIYKLQETQMRM